VTELIDYLVKLEQVDKMKRLDSDKNIKPNEGKHQRTNMLQGDNNDEQHDNSEDIDDPKEVRACPTCGKRHRGHCWHKNRNDKQGKKFCPGSAGKRAPEKMYAMEEIKELTQVSFAMFGQIDASNKKSSNKKCKTGNNEQEFQLNNMLANMRSFYHNNNNNNSSDSEDGE
jgi:hypothetical protein